MKPLNLKGGLKFSNCSCLSYICVQFIMCIEEVLLLPLLYSWPLVFIKSTCSSSYIENLFKNKDTSKEATRLEHTLQNTFEFNFLRVCMRKNCVVHMF